MNDIDNIEKKRIQMYLTARQFKNAIDIDEILIVPARKNNLEENTKLNFANVFTATARGDKMITKTFPFLVNKAFACEVYLKLILLEANVDINLLLKNHEKHDLFKLYDLTDIKNNCINYFKRYDNKVDNNHIEDEIKKISNIFIEWRYIYENFDKGKGVNSGFLNGFCDFLDTYAIILIKTNYNYDVSKDIR